MMTSDDKVGGWVKKGQNHDDVIFECPLGDIQNHFSYYLAAIQFANRARRELNRWKLKLLWKIN